MRRTRRRCAASSSSRTGRADHPVIVHLDNPKYLHRWAREVPENAQKLAARFWPGPLTMVLPRSENVHDVVTGGQDTVAIRVPSHPMAQQLLTAFGGGIAAPSANRFGRVSPTRAEHVREEFGDAVRVVLDGGESQIGLESTIVSFDGEQVRLLRPGFVTYSQLKEVVGDVIVGAAPAAPRVPGDKVSHYAPMTPMTIVPVDEIDKRAETLSEGGRRVAVLAHAPAAQDLSVGHLDQRRAPPRCLRARSVFEPARARQGGLRADPRAGRAERREVDRDPRSAEPRRRRGQRERDTISSRRPAGTASCRERARISRSASWPFPGSPWAIWSSAISTAIMAVVKPGFTRKKVKWHAAQFDLLISRSRNCRARRPSKPNRSRQLAAQVKELVAALAQAGGRSGGGARRRAPSRLSGAGGLDRRSSCSRAWALYALTRARVAMSAA